jgi:hypothetical protein
MISLDLLTPLPETCLTTSFYLMVESRMKTLSRTFRTCAKHGTLSIRWKHFSRKFNIVLNSQKPEELQLVQHTNFHLRTPRSSSLESLTVIAVDGMKNWQQTRPKTISRLTLRLHIVSTYKCKEKLWEPKYMQMLLLPKLKMT